MKLIHRFKVGAVSYQAERLPFPWIPRERWSLYILRDEGLITPTRELVGIYQRIADVRCYLKRVAKISGLSFIQEKGI